MDAAGGIWHQKVKQNVSLRDHTLSQLAAMDHPYARRHGSIRVHQSRPYSVHSQSGKMLRSIKGKSVKSGKYPAFKVMTDLRTAPHARYVIQGTKVMLPRDVIWNTGLESGTRKEMMKAVVRALGKGLRSGAALRFG